MGMLWQDVRYGLRMLVKSRRLHGGGRADAGALHRRKHRHVRRVAPSCVEASAFSGFRAARSHSGTSSGLGSDRRRNCRYLSIRP